MLFTLALVIPKIAGAFYYLEVSIHFLILYLITKITKKRTLINNNNPNLLIYVNSIRTITYINVMDALLQHMSDTIPLVEFYPDGKLKMEGKIIPEDAEALFEPWINYLKCLKAREVVFDINLIYFNTASSKKIMEMLRYLDANNQVENILINWHYEEGDEDSIEVAEIYEETLFRANFRYHEYAETES